MVSHSSKPAFSAANGSGNGQLSEYGPGWIKSVTVFCGSRPGNIEGLMEESYQTGYELAKAGYRVVYGGGNAGNMGQVARGAVKAWLEQGLTIEQIVERQLVQGITTPRLDAAQGTSPEGVSIKVYEPPSGLPLDVVLILREHEMILEGDACVALPGSFGTGMEVYMASVMNDLSNLSEPKPLRPCIYVSHNGYWQHHEQHLNGMHDSGLSTQDRRYFNHFRRTNGEAIACAAHAVEKLAELNVAPPMMSSDLKVKHAEAQKAPAPESIADGPKQ